MAKNHINIHLLKNIFLTKYNFFNQRKKIGKAYVYIEISEYTPHGFTTSDIGSDI